jgi:hypothetical protein
MHGVRRILVLANKIVYKISKKKEKPIHIDLFVKVIFIYTGEYE